MLLERQLTAPSEENRMVVREDKRSNKKDPEFGQVEVTSSPTTSKEEENDFSIQINPNALLDKAATALVTGVVSAAATKAVLEGGDE